MEILARPGINEKAIDAVSVSGNYRITFRFEGMNAVDIDLEDYH